MFRMSSMITKVLPTPAPPKMAALPPFWNGQMRSMTLIPVSRIAAALHAVRVVDLGKLALGEGDVEHRPDDLDDVPGRLRAALLRRRFRLDCHLFTPC